MHKAVGWGRGPPACIRAPDPPSHEGEVLLVVVGGEHPPKQQPQSQPSPQQMDWIISRVIGESLTLESRHSRCPTAVREFAVQ